MNVRNCVRPLSALMILFTCCIPALAQETDPDSAAIGSWKWNRETLSGEVRCEVRLEEKDGKLTGTYSDAEDNKAKVGEVSVKGEEITIELIFDADGSESSVSLKGKLDGDRIRGKIVDGSTEQDWKASRFVSIKEAAGNWRMSFTTPDGTERNPEFSLATNKDGKPVVEFEVGDDSGEADDLRVSKTRFKDGLLIFNVTLEFEGQSLKLEYELEFMNKSELEGSMFYSFQTGMEGDVDVTGERLK